MSVLSESGIERRIINNDSLFNTIHVVQQNFDIIPSENMHYGTSIDYQDLTELRDDFLNELYDTIVNWVYSSEKYAQIKAAAIKKVSPRRLHLQKFNEKRARSFVV